jgi:hypothetical protein
MHPLRHPSIFQSSIIIIPGPVGRNARRENQAGPERRAHHRTGVKIKPGCITEPRRPTGPVAEVAQSITDVMKLTRAPSQSPVDPATEPNRPKTELRDLVNVTVEHNPPMPAIRLAHRTQIRFSGVLYIIYWFLLLFFSLGWDCYSSPVAITFFFSYCYYYFSPRPRRTHAQTK